MVPAALSAQAGYAGDWVCLECEENGEPLTLPLEREQRAQSDRHAEPERDPAGDQRGDGAEAEPERAPARRRSEREPS